MPYIGNFNQQKIIRETSYTAETDCAAFAQFVTNNTNWGRIIVKVNDYYVYQYQNPGDTSDLCMGILVALRKGDIIAVVGEGLKSATIYVQYRS